MIPKKIFQSWKTKSLPPLMEANVKKIKELNPEYEHFIFDDNDCIQYLETNYGINYANAFKSLTKGAFKCDFWRYAILYKEGGVYLDMDICPLVPFDEIIGDNDTFISIVDYTHNGIHGIYQAFLACTPRHKIMFNSLEITYINIATRRRDTFNIFETLTLTGPGVVLNAINLYWNRIDTGTYIKPGRYDDIVLYSMDSDYTYDMNGEKILKNKFDGYTGLPYADMDSPYIIDPRRKRSKIIFYIVVALLLLCILLSAQRWYYKSQLESCRTSCSSSYSS